MSSSVSLIVPVYNEEENIRPLYDQLCQVMNSLERPVEAVIVDDGSTDKTRELLREVAAKDDRFKIVCFRRNYGKRQPCKPASNMPRAISW